MPSGKDMLENMMDIAPVLRKLSLVGEIELNIVIQRKAMRE